MGRRRSTQHCCSLSVSQGGGNQIGTKVFTNHDDPMQILITLQAKYGQCTPDDKRANDHTFNAPWNPSEPIEAFFDRLEECYKVAFLAKPPYMMEQMIDKAIIAIQDTGLYSTMLLEWEGFEANNKIWYELKLHFEEAYGLCLASGGGTAAAHGYVNNAEEDGDDDDSITTIHESLNSIHQANNHNYANLQEYIKLHMLRLQHYVPNWLSLNNRLQILLKP
ncbi:hypothetical protein ACHAW6_009166 [Cyclotella cf. meneghiniana]